MNIYILAAILTIAMAAVNKLVSVKNERLKTIKPIKELKDFFEGATAFGYVFLILKYILIVLILGGFGAMSTYMVITLISALHFSMISTNVVQYVTPFLITRGNWKTNLHKLITLIKEFGKEKINDSANSDALKEKDSTSSSQSDTQND